MVSKVLYSLQLHCASVVEMKLNKEAPNERSKVYDTLLKPLARAAQECE